jgi:hypothetical protein
VRAHRFFWIHRDGIRHSTSARRRKNEARLVVPHLFDRVHLNLEPYLFNRAHLSLAPYPFNRVQLNLDRIWNVWSLRFGLQAGEQKLRAERMC